METLVIKSEQFITNTVRITLLSTGRYQTYHFDTDQEAFEFFEQKKLQCPTTIYKLEIITTK